jgi:hypothetical protein
MDLMSKPKAAPVPCPPHKVLPRNAKQTLRELLTEDETKLGRITFLKQMAKLKPRSAFKDYLEFYSANQSGDIETFKPEAKVFIKKMMKDITTEWAKNQSDEGDEDAVSQSSSKT